MMPKGRSKGRTGSIIIQKSKQRHSVDKKFGRDCGGGPRTPGSTTSGSMVQLFKNEFPPAREEPVGQEPRALETTGGESVSEKRTNVYNYRMDYSKIGRGGR